MHLHVICGFPRIPLRRRELISIVPGKVDSAGGDFSAGRWQREVRPLSAYGFWKRLWKLSEETDVGSALTDLPSDSIDPFLLLQ